MSSIIRLRDTYHGIGVFGRGVFTNDKVGGRTYAGQMRNGHACGLGVLTWSDGSKGYAEHGPDGQCDGRYLVRWADGDTWYSLFERGEEKDSADLSADGTCEYNGESCRADYPPFVALQAKVLPIKARSPLVPPQPPLFMPPFFAPTARQSVPSAIVLALAGAGDDPRRQGAHLPPPPSACVGLVAQQLAKQMHRASDLDDAAGGRVHHACATTACVVHPCTRS
jgi:hypothetical protein